MEQTNQTPEVKKILSNEQKKFIGSLLSTAGVIFFLAGVMFFISLISAIYFKLDIIIGFIIGSLIIGITSFGVGSLLHK